MNPREKRALNAKRTDGKKPRCFSSEDINAALQNKLLHGTLPTWEALSRLVAEEVGRTISRMASEGRIPMLQITGSPARKFHLQFKTNPAAKSFTMTPLEDEHGAPICVFLTDANTGQPVTRGLEAVTKLEVVPLMGDFRTSEEQEWTAEEFERQVAKAREGRGPLLIGNLNVHLENGEGTLGKMSFTDNSSFTRSKMFRLGVRVAQDNEYGIMSIREGKSEAFRVIESRGKAYKKHDTPSPTDDVWRLQNIGKGGPYDLKLRENGINTVEDFLLRLKTTPELLKGVLGKMPEKAYQETIDHAKKCILGYIYPVERPPYESLIFNPEYQMVGAVAEGQFVGLEMVDDGTEKVHIDRLVKMAYDDWDTDVTEYAVEDLAEPSMIAPPGAVDGPLGDDMVDVAAAPEEAVDGSLADDVLDVADMVDVAAAPQEDVYGSLGTEGVPSLEPITEQAECSFEVGSWSELEAESLSKIVAGEVQQVISEESGEPVEPSPPVDRWWLRIRSVVRCALFIRRAGLVARSL